MCDTSPISPYLKDALESPYPPKEWIAGNLRLMRSKGELSSYIVTSPPEVVRIEPSSACNLRCTHCPTGVLDPVNRGVMSKETLEIILDQLNELRPRVVVLYHGGEPFLNKDIIYMINELKSLGVKFVKTVTNGLLLTDAMLTDIILSGLDNIEFSLDGTSFQEHHRIRGLTSDYTKVVSRIKKLAELKLVFSSDTPRIFIANTQIINDHEPNPGPEVPTHIADDLSGCDISFKCNWAILWPAMPLETDVYRRYVPLARQLKNYCEHPYVSLTIRHDGSVVPCCYDITSMQVLGNVHDSTIHTIWNNDRYLEFRRDIHNRECPDLCEHCHVISSPSFLVRKEVA